MLSKLSTRSTSSVSGDHDGSFLVCFFWASKRCAGHRSRKSRTPSAKVRSLRLYWGNVCTDAKHGSGDGVRGIVAQVNQRQQHFLVGRHLAGAPAADDPLAPKQAEGGGFEAEQGADTVFGKRLSLMKVHAVSFGTTKTFLYYTEYLLLLQREPAVRSIFMGPYPISATAWNSVTP